MAMLIWSLSSHVARWVAPLDAVTPWFGFVVRLSFDAVAKLTMIATPAFVFLTVINSTERLLLMRLVVSVAFSVWWSILLALVFLSLLLLVFGLPALLFDVASWLVGGQWT